MTIELTKPVIHELKVYPHFWPRLLSGEKPFEVRRNDRNFKVGELCRFREFDPKSGARSVKWLDKRISYILQHEDMPVGLKPGYVVLGLAEVEEPKPIGWMMYDPTGARDEFSELPLTVHDKIAGWSQREVYEISVP